jgi:hypothetical protein
LKLVLISHTSNQIVYKIPTDYVPLSELMEAKDGQKVMVKLVNWFDGAKP